jgi:hypothetical protein
MYRLIFRGLDLVEVDGLIRGGQNVTYTATFERILANLSYRRGRRGDRACTKPMAVQFQGWPF